MPQDDSKATPPYVTYATFKRFISQLADSLIPDQVDKHTLDKFSGGEKAALIPALKFLGLIDDATSPTDEMKTLVQAICDGPDSWRSALSALLKARYKGITDGVDMVRGTAAQLDKAFRDYGVSQSVLPKSARFFLQAVEETGVAISPYMKTKRRAAKKRTAPKPAPAPDKPATSPADAPIAPGNPPQHLEDEVSAGFARLPIPGVKGGFIQYPEALTAGDCTMYETMVGTLRKLVEVQGKGAQQ